MIRDEVNNDYFNWLCSLIGQKRYPKGLSYTKLLSYLHNTEFTYLISRDANRADDGISLRWRFVCQTDIEVYNIHYQETLNYLEGPCSILEMMVALAVKCEETIMDDAGIGDRTGQWFWGMVVNLGLGSMSDARFDIRLAEEIIACFLERDYEPNGKGGLFTVRHCDRDLRDVEIWYQLCWYLDSIT